VAETQKLTQTFVMKKKDDPDPIPAFKFWVEMKSIVVAEFKECTGLSMERDFEKIEEGGVNDHWTWLPGRNRYSNIVLKYGVMYSRELWDWYQKGLLDLKVERADFSILLRDLKGDVVKRWNVTAGFPVKWEGPALNVESSQASIETLEIAHHGLALAQ
jgi:phage tail-like protein